MVAGRPPWCSSASLVVEGAIPPNLAPHWATKNGVGNVNLLSFSSSSRSQRRTRVGFVASALGALFSLVLAGAAVAVPPVPGTVIRSWNWLPLAQQSWVSQQSQIDAQLVCPNCGTDPFAVPRFLGADALYSIAPVTSSPPPPPGEAASLLFDVRKNDDPFPVDRFGDRAQINATNTVFSEGGQYWAGFSFYLNPANPISSEFQVLAEWHSQGNGPPPFAFYTPGNNLTLDANRTGPNDQFLSVFQMYNQPIQRGVWHTVQIGWVASSSDTVGRVRFFLDGVEKTLADRGNGPGVVRTIPPDHGTYFAYSNYYDHLIDTVTGVGGQVGRRVIAYGGLRITQGTVVGAVIPGTGTSRLGDFVWEDLNRDGLQTTGEPGIAGAAVALLDGSTGTQLQTTTTDATGHYAFTGLAAGQYKLRFTTPTGFTPTLAGVPPFTANSKPIGGLTSSFALAANAIDNNLDAGFYRTGTSRLGDFVWNDLNRNGLQAAGEPGIAGVTVALLDGNSGTQLQTTTTDATGRYAFTGLAAGQYKLRFTTPTGFTPTLAGVQPFTANSKPVGGLTSSFALAANATDNNLDAGFYQ